MRRRLPLLAAALVAACSPDAAAPPPSGLTTTFDTIGGVIHVTNTGDAPPARLVPVVSIGPRTLTETGSPDEFGGVTSMALSPGGEVFVADARNLEVRVFGLDGIHRRTFGREGEGPGEFQSISSLAWVGDQLLTYDPVFGRVGRWSSEGEWLGQHRTRGRVGSSFSGPRLFPVGPDEAYRRALGATYETRFGRAVRSLYVGLDSRGETGDTLPRLEDPPGIPESFILCEYGEGFIRGFSIPFGSGFTQTPGQGGAIYSALTSEYRITVTRNDGADTLRVIGREMSAEPIGDDEWEEGVQEWEEWRAQNRSASCEPSGPTRPPTKPIIGTFYLATDGKLWVLVPRDAGDRWEVFDPDGRLLGSAPAPANVPGRAALGPSDELLTLRRDSLDLDHVDIWRFEAEIGR